MKLSIISLKGVEFDGEVISLNVKTTSGEITVLDHHRPLITSLVEGSALVVKNDGDVFDFDIKSGFLEVSDKNVATLLAS